jgi:hypothetical protein
VKYVGEISDLKRQTIKKSSKLSCYRHAADKGERKHTSYFFLTKALDWWGVVSVMPWSRFTPGERAPGTHRIGGCVGLRAGLDTG